MSKGERYALFATLAIATFISGPWFYAQLLVWKAEGHDHMLTVGNIIVTALLWSVLILGTTKYWRGSKRSEALEARNANDRADFEAKIGTPFFSDGSACLQGGYTNDEQFSPRSRACGTEAVLEVKEVYFPFWEQTTASAPPGKITLVVVCADEPAGKPVADCTKRTVCLTIHRGAEDDRLLQTEGPAAFRRSRIPELCQEALSQGALLTREDLAYRIFFVGTRTLSRDLSILRQQSPSIPLPMRSTVHDIGPVLTHRVQVVRLALQGKTTSEICSIRRHSPAAIANYLSTFARCVQLAHRNMQTSQIAFLLHRGRGLIESYLELLAECERDNNMTYHLQQLLQLGQCTAERPGKKKEEGVPHMSRDPISSVNSSHPFSTGRLRMLWLTALARSFLVWVALASWLCVRR